MTALGLICNLKKKSIKIIDNKIIKLISNMSKNSENPNTNPKQHFHLISCGVSGGEEGALHGPSIMPSGEPEIVNSLLPILEKIAALDFEGKPCVTNIGLGPSGHFVKMVHNGIEYALMQGIAEIYDILRYNSYSNDQIRKVFIELNQGELKSFLLDITIKILETKDNLGEGFLLDQIKDQAGAKGTGSWTIEAALELGVAVPTIAAAVFARIMSARNHRFDVYKRNVDRNMLPKYWQNVFELKDSLDGLKYRERDFEQFETEQTNIKDTLFYQLLSHIYKVSYLQGLELIIETNKIYKWNIDINEVLRIWQGGCIIRSQMLENLIEIYRNNNEESFNLREFIDNYRDKLQDILPHNDLPLPVIHSVFDYILSITNKNLPTNLIQAQRDFFGAHTFERIDKLGTFSGGWNKI